jgi:hypothetical protein
VKLLEDEAEESCVSSNNSIAMKVRPSDSSISWIVQMLGWFRHDAGFASRLEAAEGLCIIGEIIGEEFERNGAVEPGAIAGLQSD